MTDFHFKHNREPIIQALSSLLNPIKNLVDYYLLNKPEPDRMFPDIFFIKINMVD